MSSVHGKNCTLLLLGGFSDHTVSLHQAGVSWNLCRCLAQAPQPHYDCHSPLSAVDLGLQ